MNVEKIITLLLEENGGQGRVAQEGRKITPIRSAREQAREQARPRNRQQDVMRARGTGNAALKNAPFNTSRPSRSIESADSSRSDLRERILNTIEERRKEYARGSSARNSYTRSGLESGRGRYNSNSSRGFAYENYAKRVSATKRKAIEELISDLSGEDNYENVETIYYNLAEDTISFNEEEFAEMLDINPDTVVGIAIQEEEEIPEHIEIRYEQDKKDVVLKIFPNGAIDQIVNAKVYDAPEFEAILVQTVDEEGEIVPNDITLTLNLLEEENDLPKTEEETDTFDEEGRSDTKEYVDPAGLDLDHYYSHSHNMKSARNAGNRLEAKYTSRAKESAASQMANRPARRPRPSTVIK